MDDILLNFMVLRKKNKFYREKANPNLDRSEVQQYIYTSKNSSVNLGTFLEMFPFLIFVTFLKAKFHLCTLLSKQKTEL